MRQLTVLVLIVLLAACAGQPPAPTPVDRDAPNFSVVADPELVILRLDESATVNLNVHRANGFSGSVTVRPHPESPLPAGLSLETVTVPADRNEALLTLTLSDNLPVGTHPVVLQAVSGDLVRLVTFRVQADAPHPRIDRAFLEPGHGRQARQGQDDTVLVLEGQHFERVSGYELEGFSVSLLPGGSNTSVRLSFSVPHGATPGVHDLVISTSGFGDSVLYGALEVTPISAAPAGDDAGPGTSGAPFRTLDRALDAAGAGDEIRLAAGEYTSSSWPEQEWGATSMPAALPASNVPDGVAVRGAGSGATVIRGPGPFEVPLAIGLSLAGSAEVRDLQLTGFSTAVVAAAGELTITDVLLDGNSEGILLLGSVQADISDSRIQGAIHQAIRLGGTAGLTASGVELSGNGWGIDLIGSATVRLEDSSVSGSDFQAVRATDETVVHISDSQLESSQASGILFAGRELVLRGTSVTGNGDSGLRVEADPVLVDLGTLTESGGNSFSGNAPWQLHDARPDSTAGLSGLAISVSGTSLQGVIPEAGIQVGPAGDGDLWRIDGVDQLIEFQ